ncbi:MAG: YheU family protein [Porticoccaceae bacterium]|nr:YheU family protein [Porticoccaceae bacterium]
MILVPFERLDKETLRAVIEEFVLREGTEYGIDDCSIDAKVTQVERQLQRGEVVISYDEAAETCTLMLQREYYQRLRQTSE